MKLNQIKLNQMQVLVLYPAGGLHGAVLHDRVQQLERSSLPAYTLGESETRSPLKGKHTNTYTQRERDCSFDFQNESEGATQEERQRTYDMYDTFFFLFLFFIRSFFVAHPLPLFSSPYVFFFAFCTALPYACVVYDARAHSVVYSHLRLLML